jgi:hypothetical protein
MNNNVDIGIRISAVFDGRYLRSSKPFYETLKMYGDYWCTSQKRKKLSLMHPLPLYQGLIS